MTASLRFMQQRLKRNRRMCIRAGLNARLVLVAVDAFMKVRTAFRKLSDAWVMPCVLLPLRMVLGSALHKSEFVLSANCGK